MKCAVIGAGPIGLDCAAHLLESGHEVIVLERGPTVGAAVAEWGNHVQLFTPNGMNVSDAMRTALARAGEALPDVDACPTGAQYVAHVLGPLARALAKTHGERFEVRVRTEVISVGRGRLRKTEAVAAVGDKRREGAPFHLLVRRLSPGAARHAEDDKVPEEEEEEEMLVEIGVVVDASGSYGARTANALGPTGTPVPGERAVQRALHARQAESHAPRLFRTIPDVLGADRAAFAGRRICLVGSGYSAATAALALGELAALGAGAKPASVLWLTRTERPEPLARVPNDSLPRRDELCARANALCGSSAHEGATPGAGFGIKHVPSAAITRLAVRASSVPSSPLGAFGAFALATLRLALQAVPFGRPILRALVGLWPALRAATAALGVGRQHIEVTYECAEPAATNTADVDTLVSLVGYHPDLSLHRELHVHTCYASEGPMKLAAALLAAQSKAAGENSSAASDCMQQAAPGPATLLTPEPRFFVVGAKSYGRNSAFLLRIGFEQAAALPSLLPAATGDESAKPS